MTKPLKMQLSASQLNTAKTCLLSWWFQKVQKLPQPFDRKQLLGEVGHGACERFLLSKPIYPEGWTAPINRFNGRQSEHHITTTEQALVKALVSHAITDGVLLPHPDQTIEREFRLPVGNVEGVDVSLIGYIDHQYGNHIDDHKFTGSPRYYGPTALDEAIAMHLYAWAMYEQDVIKEPTAWLRYNLFVKDTSRPQVKVVQIEKTKEAIYRFYEDNIVPLYKPMAMAMKNCTEWYQIDSAMKQGCAKSACEAYGGCPFLEICLGKITMDQYRARFASNTLEDRAKSQQDVLQSLLNPQAPIPKTAEERTLDIVNPTGVGKQSTTQAPEQGKENKMAGFLSKLKSEQTQEQAKVPVAQAPVNQAPVAQAPVAPAPVAQAPVAQVAQPSAPWAFVSCPVCKGIGIHKGTPCNICVISTNAMKLNDPSQPVLADFDVVVGEDGLVKWTSKEGQEVAQSQVTEQPVEVSEKVRSLGGDSFDAPKQVQESNPPVVSLEEVAEEPATVDSSVALEAEGINTEGESEASEPSVAGPVFDNLDPKDLNQERQGFVISYAPLRSRKRVGKKLGESNCVVYLSEILEFVEPNLLALANAAGACAKAWLEVDVWKRRDLLRRNAKEISELVGNSMIDASNVLSASDEEVLASVLERYALIVAGGLRG